MLFLILNLIACGFALGLYGWLTVEFLEQKNPWAFWSFPLALCMVVYIFGTLYILVHDGNPLVTGRIGAAYYRPIFPIVVSAPAVAFFVLRFKK